MGEQQRSTPARIGVTALNLIGPGLGLVRVAGLRAAIWLIAGPTVILLSVILLGRLAPRPNFTAFVIAMTLVIVASIALYIYAIVRTWRASRSKSASSFWSRWYGLVLIVLVTIAADNLAVQVYHGIYRPFYILAESMLPTLAVNDRIFVDMRGGHAPVRGDLILFNAPGGAMYIKRVAALAGDRIEMRAGVPIVNGKPPFLKNMGDTAYENGPAHIRQEQLAGETGTHLIWDLDETAIDYMPERIVPAGHVFVLGDNRDRSADSRLSRTELGVEMLPESDITGTPLFIYWSNDRAKIGKSLIAPNK
ncbi:signal peptidase I [Sphingomonas sp.]|uniref:signal peptidase I n=1 Tax=Sphingomonas sp. TaxID=28214 RepID=UPI003D6D92F7